MGQSVPLGEGGGTKTERRLKREGKKGGGTEGRTQGGREGERGDSCLVLGMASWELGGEALLKDDDGETLLFFLPPSLGMVCVMQVLCFLYSDLQPGYQPVARAEPDSDLG